MINTILGPILGIADKVLDRVIPDPEARAKAKLEFAQQASKLGREDIKEFHEFVVQYEGAGEKVHPVIQILRGSVRPVLTYALAGAYIYGFMNPATFTPDVMSGLFNLNIISLGFWYGNRALKDLGLNLGKKRS